MIDLFAPVERNAAFTPDKAALHFEGETLTYAAFSAHVRAVAADLGRAGVKRGDRVAVLAYNHSGTLAMFFACARLGAMLVPLNWRLAHDELAYAVSHAEPAMLVFGPGLEAAGAALEGPFHRRALTDLGRDGEGDAPAAGAPDAPCLMVYTSGTTGRPKAALIDQGALMGNAVQAKHMHQMSAADHVLTLLPLFHVGGLNIQTTPALIFGATVTLHARFDPSATLAAIATGRPTLSVFVPAVMQALMEAPGFNTADLSSLRAIATGSTIVPEALIEAFEERGVGVLCVYGATETCPIAAYDRFGVPRTRGATGRAGLLSDIVILGEDGTPAATGAHGEIGVRGPSFSGYFRDEAATRAALTDGLVRTGDVGSLARDGTLTVHARLKSVIISGGENIYPAEVERVLCDHPAVADCAVVGMADPRWQEVPVAFVVPCGEVTREALTAHTARFLARYKVPRRIMLVDALPRTALGKVDTAALRAELRSVAAQ